MSLTVIKVPGKKSFAHYILTNGIGTIVGQLEKYRNTRTEKHPWKAFSGTGFERKFLGSFYENEGGKKAAIATIYHATYGG